MNTIAKYTLIHDRTSFCVAVYARVSDVFHRVDYVARCSRCGRLVKMNGPGSDKNFFTRIVKSLLWVVKSDTQALFTPAADLHDMQCHQGLDDAALRAANKEFRNNCMLLIEQRYGDAMRGLSRELMGKPNVRFIDAIFSSEKRALWRKQRDLRELIIERKDKERDAELYYTALKLASRSVVPSTPCTEREYDEDC